MSVFYVGCHHFKSAYVSCLHDVKSEHLFPPFYRTKVQAQRKFAQGSSPMVTPVKEAPVEVDTTPIVPMAPVFTQPPVNQPKTEDFLTYLCFRGELWKSREFIS